ncbi:MAG: site-specific integrase [Oscillospiraceae bacterium]
MAKSKEIEDMAKQYWGTALLENKELMQEYLDSSTELSNKTLLQYESALRIFVSYLNKACGNKHLTKVTPLDFKKYLNYLYKCGILESAMKAKRSPISMLNEHIILYHGEEFNTFRNYVTKAVKTPSTEKRYVKEPLTGAEYKALCDYLEEKGEWQKLAYFKFTYCTGCRCNESRQLLKEVVNYEPILKTIKLKDEDGKPYNADVKKYKTNLIKTKGKKSKEKVKLSFDEETMGYLKKWLEIRGEDDCPYMFITHKEAPKQVGEDVFRYWCKALEPIVGRRFHPHLIRSSRATGLSVEENMPIEAIQRLLGHQSSETTKIYIMKDDSDDEDEIFAR